MVEMAVEAEAQQAEKAAAYTSATVLQTVPKIEQKLD
jgi:hypothetical protein